MLNVEKVQIMTDLARYEANKGEEELRISRHFKRDYVGIAMFKNLLLTTIGYLLLWAAIVVDNMDFLLNNAHRMDLLITTTEFVVGYIIFILIYSIITHKKYHAKYARAKSNIKGYYSRLNALAKGYDAKPKKELVGGKR